MTETSEIRCDGCGKLAPDKSNKGWLRITLTEDYSVDWVGKNDDDTFTILASDRLDFCTPECMARWAKNAIKKVLSY